VVTKGLPGEGRVPAIPRAGIDGVSVWPNTLPFGCDKTERGVVTAVPATKGSTA